MIELRRAQRSFGDGLIADEVKDLREGWMSHADRLLDDEAIVAAVYEALGRRHPKSRSRGRLGAPADVVLRLLVLKHVRNFKLRGPRARSARQPGLSRLHSRRRRQDARRQDDRPPGDWRSGRRPSSRCTNGSRVRQVRRGSSD